MSQTDNDPAALFYASMLLPLSHANLRRGVHYFSRGPDPACESYWEPPASRTGGSERLSATAQGADALLDALGRYWRSHNEQVLSRLLPGLEAVRQNLTQGRTADQEKEASVPDFVYPLY